MITVYGIKNCDTIKKTGKLLDSIGLTWQLHDYRRDGLDEALLKTLTEHFGPDELINKRGTTWRQLAPAQQQAMMNTDSAPALLPQFCAAIRRPIVQTADKRWLIGFEAVEQAAHSRSL